MRAVPCLLSRSMNASSIMSPRSETCDMTKEDSPITELRAIVGDTYAVHEPNDPIVCDYDTVLADSPPVLLVAIRLLSPRT